MHDEQVVEDHHIPCLPRKQELTVAADGPYGGKIPRLDLASIAIGGVTAQALLASRRRIESKRGSFLAPMESFTLSKSRCH